MKTSSSQRLSVKKGNSIRFSRFSPLITKINHCCLSYHSSVLKVHFRIRDVTFKESKGYQKSSEMFKVLFLIFTDGWEIECQEKQQELQYDRGVGRGLRMGHHGHLTSLHLLHQYFADSLWLLQKSSYGRRWGQWRWERRWRKKRWSWGADFGCHPSSVFAFGSFHLFVGHVLLFRLHANAVCYMHSGNCDGCIGIFVASHVSVLP